MENGQTAQPGKFSSNTAAVVSGLVGCLTGILFLLGAFSSKAQPDRRYAVPLLWTNALEAQTWSESAAWYYRFRLVFPSAKVELQQAGLLPSAHLFRLARVLSIEVKSNRLPEPSFQQKVRHRTAPYQRTTSFPLEFRKLSSGQDTQVIIIEGDEPGIPNQIIQVFKIHDDIFIVPSAWMKDQGIGR